MVDRTRFWCSQGPSMLGKAAQLQLLHLVRKKPISISEAYVIYFGDLLICRVGDQTQGPLNGEQSL